MKMPKQGIQRLKIDDTGSKSSTKKANMFKFNASAVEDHGKPGTNQKLAQPLFLPVIGKCSNSKKLSKSKELKFDMKKEMSFANSSRFSQNLEGVPN